MKTLFSRASRAGLGYGLATTLIEIGIGSYIFFSQNFPPMPANMAKAAVSEIAVGWAIGLLLLPVLLIPGRSGAWHALAMATVWTALQHWLAINPAEIGSWTTAPLGGLLLFAGGAWIAKRRPLLPTGIAVTALALIVAAPSLLTEADKAPEAPTAQAVAGAPDVVLIVLDTVRARNLSTYGYNRPTSPTLDRLAADSALFLDATSPSTWSLPSHASLFTGWLPSAHNSHAENRRLRESPPTLADVLTSAGYDTRCFTANPHISSTFGLTRGFAWTDQGWLAGGGGRAFTFVYRLLDRLGFGVADKGGAMVADNFEHWAAERKADGRPAFVFINFLEAHFPYHQVPEDFLRQFTELPMSELQDHSLIAFAGQFGRELDSEEVLSATLPSVDMYDAGVLYSDALLERIVDTLEKAGTLDETVLVVLSDHGEMIGEHGEFGHGPALYQEDLHVPLLVRYPPTIAGGVRVSEPVPTLAVLPTILDLLDLDNPGPLHAGSLLPLIDGSADNAGPVIAERYSFPRDHSGKRPPLAQADRRYRVYRSGQYKLVETSVDQTHLYDLDADPGENNDLSAVQPQLLARLRTELMQWQERLGLPELSAAIVEHGDHEEAMTPALKRSLEALGYVD